MFLIFIYLFIFLFCFVSSDGIFQPSEHISDSQVIPIHTKDKGNIDNFKTLLNIPKSGRNCPFTPLSTEWKNLKYWSKKEVMEIFRKSLKNMSAEIDKITAYVIQACKLAKGYFYNSYVEKNKPSL